MARKVFISFLGTTDYVECIYKFNETKSEPVRFVQEALIAQICKDWTSEDRIFIFCTSKETMGEEGSKEKNWFGENGLKNRLDALRESTSLKPAIEEVDINAGFTEEETWKIFNVVYSKLEHADHIYFDVTHAFRSIPLFSVVLFNYSKFMVGTQLEMIVYGAFEKLGPGYKVREMPLEKRIAPLVDLTNIARLQAYNQIASGLKEFGKVKQIKNAINEDQSSASDQVLKDLSASVTELDEYITTINLKSIKSGNYITKFRNSYKNVKRKAKLVEPISNILTELYKETEDFVSENSFRNIEAAINWTIKHEMLMQAYPLAEEYVILRVSDELSDFRPSGLKSQKFREFIGSLLGMPDMDFSMKNWDGLLASYPGVADDMSKESLIKDLRPKYEKIRRCRNSLAHGNGEFEYAKLEENIPAIVSCIGFLSPEYKTLPSTKYILELLVVR